MERFIVSARKYRPKDFESVVGQEHITFTLKNAIKSNQIASSYLFCGPRGVGKTTCARVLAKTLNCENLQKNYEACNVCQACKSFINSQSFNIHELDAASNNSVEDIRNLIERVQITPQVGRYSIYIIDEVHMLSTSAFNAFLKTLEEPPANVVFILATTEKQKIIPTILSRCQIYDFKRISVTSMIKYLEYVAKQENISAEKSALNIIARKSDGSLRDALSFFDQIVSFSTNKVTYQDTIKNLNELDYEYYFSFISNFLKCEITPSLLLLDKILYQGFDVIFFMQGLANHIRDILVCKDKATIPLLELEGNIRDRYVKQANLCSIDFLYTALETINKYALQYKDSPNKRWLAELLLIQLTNIQQQKKNKIIPTHSPEKITEKKMEKKDSTVVQHKTKEKKLAETPTVPSSSSIELQESISIIRQHEQESNVEENEKKNSKMEHIPEPSSFSSEQIGKKIQEFIQHKNLDLRTASSLSKYNPKVIPKENIVKIRIDNILQEKDISKTKISLEQYLQKELRNNAITIESLLIEKPSDNAKKPYTDKEKFEHMKKKNKFLSTLKDDLQLDFE